MQLVMLPKNSLFQSSVLFSRIWEMFSIYGTGKACMYEIEELVQLVGVDVRLVKDSEEDDEAESISEGVHGGSHLARHHSSGEQLVQLNQLVGCGVELECNAVQRVPRFHLDHKTRKEDRESHSCFGLGNFSLKLAREDVMMCHRG